MKTFKRHWLKVCEDNTLRSIRSASIYFWNNSNCYEMLKMERSRYADGIVLVTSLRVLTALSTFTLCLPLRGFRFQYSYFIGSDR